MSISTALANANSGLSAASTRASVISSNVANALTPGYSRRSVNLSENVVAGEGAGVTFNGVTRASDQALTNDRRKAESALNRDQAVASTYADFNTALGEPDDPYSLFAQYENLETALRSLSLTPESQPLQTQTLDAAKSLASTFNQLSAQAQTTRRGAETQIAQQVDSVNSALKQIEDLNNQISLAGAGGRDVTALEDQRKTLIDQVSAAIPVREVQRDNNKIDLMTDEGVFLLAGTAREISFTPANAMTPDATYAGGALSGLSVEGVDITPSGSGGFAVRQGSIAGLFAIRDDVAPGFQSQLDALARDLMERFEGVDPSLAAGDPGLFTDAGAAFDPLAETGLAGRIAVNAAVDPDQGGAVWRVRDGLGAAAEGPSGNADIIFTLLDSLTALKTPPVGAGLNGQLSAADMAAGVASSVGSARVNAETRVASSAARTQSLKDAETAATAVDTDQELQQLLIVEQAFSANARVIQTADDMIQKLLEL